MRGELLLTYLKIIANKTIDTIKKLKKKKILTIKKYNLIYITLKYLSLNKTFHLCDLFNF